MFSTHSNSVVYQSWICKAGAIEPNFSLISSHQREICFGCILEMAGSAFANKCDRQTFGKTAVPFVLDPFICWNRISYFLTCTENMKHFCSNILAGMHSSSPFIYISIQCLYSVLSRFGILSMAYIKWNTIHIRFLTCCYILHCIYDISTIHIHYYHYDCCCDTRKSFFTRLCYAVCILYLFEKSYIDILMKDKNWRARKRLPISVWILCIFMIFSYAETKYSSHRKDETYKFIFV